MDIATIIKTTADLSVLPNLPACQSKKNELPPIPAIYVVFEPPNEILYIGRTTNLRKRWRTQNFPIVKWRVTWFEVDTVKLDKLERRLIGLFCPPMNINHNPKVKGQRRPRVVEVLKWEDYQSS